MRRSVSHEHAAASERSSTSRRSAPRRTTLSAASDIDKSFLLAMARDDGPSKMADIQQRLDVDGNYSSLLPSTSGECLAPAQGPGPSRRPALSEPVLGAVGPGHLADADFAPFRRQ